MLVSLGIFVATCNTGCSSSPSGGSGGTDGGTGGKGGTAGTGTGGKGGTAGTGTGGAAGSSTGGRDGGTDAGAGGTTTDAGTGGRDAAGTDAGAGGTGTGGTAGTGAGGTAGTGAGGTDAGATGGRDAGPDSPTDTPTDIAMDAPTDAPIPRAAMLCPSYPPAGFVPGASMSATDFCTIYVQLCLGANRDGGAAYANMAACMTGYAGMSDAGSTTYGTKLACESVHICNAYNLGLLANSESNIVTHCGHAEGMGPCAAP